MPLFRFVVNNELDIQDGDAIEFENKERAVAEAVRAAREMMMDAVVESRDFTRWIVRIYDEADNLVETVYFANLLD